MVPQPSFSVGDLAERQLSQQDEIYAALRRGIKVNEEVPVVWIELERHTAANMVGYLLMSPDFRSVTRLPEHLGTPASTYGTSGSPCP